MIDSTAGTPASRGVIRAPRGPTLSCKSWQQEAALRMFMNHCDPEVAEPGTMDAAVHGGPAQAARNWSCYDTIVASLRGLANDETLLVRSGKPVGIFRTHSYAPRVLIVSANLTGHANNRECSGLPMHCARTAGSWIDIGSQAILSCAYETFSGAARKHFGGDLAGKLVVSGGMGRMGGVQPLAVTLNGGAFLGIEVDPEHIKSRVKTGYCDVMVNDLDEALRILKNAVRKREPASVGLAGNCAEVVPALAKRGVVPDLLTDQTSPHDPLHGYIPQGLNLAAAAELRRRDSEEYRRRALDSIAAHVRGMLALQKLGSVTFDSGNNIRTWALQQGVKDAGDFPSFVPAYLQPVLCQGIGPLCWVALSGKASDIRRTDQLVLDMFPQNEALQRWVRLAEKRVRFQGLPARVCWLGYGERTKFGLALNGLVARGELAAPMVIGQNDPACAAAASADCENESLRDGSRTIADWALLHAILSTAGGASWVSIHHGGGDGGGCSQCAGQAIVADGTPEMGARIDRVLANDPGVGVAACVDAGYPEAIDFARKAGIRIPMK